MSFEIVDTAEDYLVKTPNYYSTPISEAEAVTRLPLDSPILTAIESPYIQVQFGQKNGDVTVRQWSYNKEKYSINDVERIMGEKLFKCIRCSSNRKSRVGEKEMAYVNYMAVGKEVLIAGIGGTIAGAAHFMFLAPQFAGQNIMGIKTSTIVDGVVAFVAGIATKMYAKSIMGQLVGYGVAGTILAIGILDQFNLLGAPAVARLAVPAMQAPFIPRASVLAAPGVVVNKHGTVPEMAPGTFG